SGVLIVIDELGKLLEYSALHPERSDIFVLQELAEAAQDRNRMLFVMTALHQSFDQYAQRLSRGDREEWMKVQGRVEDMAFQEPTEQILQILRSMFSEKSDFRLHQEMEELGTQLGERAWELELWPTSDKFEAVALLRDILPLHPIVALTLGSVFRRFGQNERS